MKKEVIKPIKEFPGYYVSNKGNVYSKKSGELTPLSPRDYKNGYLDVRLYKDSKGFHRLVHRLVAEAFIPNPKNLPQVNHLNEDKLNNSAENLDWCSQIDNLRYSKCKPCIDLITGAIYPSARDASKALKVHVNTIASSLKHCGGKYKDHRFMYLPKATDESINTIEFFGKKYEIPIIMKAEELFNEELD